MDKIFVKKCDNYDYDKIYSIIKKGMLKLGGIKNYIEPNSKVFLKANLLMGKDPSEGITTHPIVIKALGNYLIKENNNEVIVGDSPGGPYNKKALMKIYKKCGYTEALKDTSIKLNMNFETSEIKFNGKILNKMKIIKSIQDVDYVISFAKLKTHGMMKYTGAVKNMFGVIPGVLKAEFHFRMPKIEDFSNMLLDVCLGASPVLSFIDGIVSMEGAGPSSGDLVNSNLLLISNSPYALDYFTSDLVGIEPYSIPTVKQSIQRGLVEEDLSCYQYYGDPIEEISVKKFKSPKVNKIDFLDNFLPKFLSEPISSVLKPKLVFDYDRCIKCGICKEACPPKAIDMIGNSYPKVNVKKCISCFCCQELCPEKVISIKRLWLLDKFFKE